MYLSRGLKVWIDAAKRRVYGTIGGTPESEIERIIQEMIPELRVALKRTILDGVLVDCFDCAEAVKSGVGVKWTCFIAVEGAAAVLEGTMKGLDESTKIWNRQIKALNSELPNKFSSQEPVPMPYETPDKFIPGKVD
jgi:hypothetical protein